jgi:tetratricopeptide (TPR) repeat protein
MTFRTTSVLLLFLGAPLFFMGCSGSKSYSKKGKKLQEAGMHHEAADFFYQALVRNPTNLDAKIGLKEEGQFVLEEELNRFYKAYSVKNDREAVYSYLGAKRYSKKMSAFVRLEIPPYYEEYFEEILDVYLLRRYEEAEDLMYEEKFEEAQKIYSEINTLRPGFKDAGIQSNLAKAEPLYRLGVAYFEQGKYRKTYDLMDQVLKLDPQYKDAIDYKENALELGQYVIAVMEFEDNTKKAGTLKTKVRSSVISELTNSKDPFIRVIDRSNIDAILKEQKLSVTGVTGGESAIQAGNLIGANTLVNGRLLAYSSNPSTIRRHTRQGFEAYRVKKFNPETGKNYYVTRYRKVVYYEYKGTSSMSASFEYQIVDAETGEVLHSDVVSETRTDNVNYATYKGNYRNLYAGRYKTASGDFITGDKIYKSSSDKRALDAQFTSQKKTLKSTNQLSVELSNSISQKVSRGITSYNPD